MRRCYVVLLRVGVPDEIISATFVHLGEYRSSSPARARKLAADRWGLVEAEELIAVPDHYWQAETFVPAIPTLGLGV